MRLPLLALIFPLLAIADQSQVPMVPQGSVYVPQKSTLPTLADLLTIEPSASIFYSYAREIVLSEIFSGEAMATVLVPTNKAVIALPRKPHQGPKPTEGGTIISEQEFDDLSKQNVERWVSAHIIPQSPISLSDMTYPTLLPGKSIPFRLLDGDEDVPEWARVLVDGPTRIVGMKEALNGVLYFIDTAISID